MQACSAPWSATGRTRKSATAVQFLRAVQHALAARSLRGALCVRRAVRSTRGNSSRPPRRLVAAAARRTTPRRGAAGTRAVVSAQHEAMLTLMSVRRAGGPAHLSERGSSSLNAWAASEGASSMLKSSSPGHLPTLMRSCAGEDCWLPEKRALVRSAGGAAVRRAGRGASGLPAGSAALRALCAQGAGILAAEASPASWRGGWGGKVFLK